MCTPNIPAPPDPRMVAGAQTATNIGTSIANTILRGQDVYGPDSKLNYKLQRNKQGDKKYHQYVDPNTGDVHKIPMMEVHHSLTGDAKRISEHAKDAKLNLAKTANERSDFLRKYLSGPSGIQAPDYQDVNGKLNLQDSNVNPKQATLNSRPQYQEMGSGPDLRNVDQAGNLDARIGRTGDVTKSYGGDFSKDRRRVEDALYSRMDEKFAQDEEALRTRLANQGLTPGSEAFRREMDMFREGKNDARMQAILAGGQEQSRMVGLEADRARFQNSAQAQRFGQAFDRTAFGNDVVNQRFENDMARKAFNNANRQGEFDNRFASQSYNNDLQQRGLQDEAARKAFNNSARQTMGDARFRNLAFNNQNTMTGRDDDFRRAGFNNANETQRLNTAMAMRNQPLNEITALLSGSQVNAPMFTPNQPTGFQPTNVAGIYNNNYNQQLGRAQLQSNNFMRLLGMGVGLL